MNQTIECLGRGSGKIFALVRFDDGADELALRSASEAGSPVPALMFPFEDATLTKGPGRRFVAVVPQLTCGQTLEFLRRDEDAGAASGDGGADETAATGVTRTNGPLPFASLTLSPNDAKWRSRFNYRVRRELTMAIRDYDFSRSNRQIAIVFDKVIDDFDDEILRGSLNTPPDLEGPVTIQLLDLAAHPIEAAVTIMGDAIATPDDRPELRYRRIAFSVRSRRLAAPFIAVAVDGNGRMLQGFRVVDGPELEDLRGRGLYIRMNAGWDPAYDGWFRAHRITESELATQRATKLDYEPLFSLVVPLYETPLPYFYELAESVLGQSYRHWELILVNASPDDDGLRAAADELAALCDQVRVLTLAKNGGISANSNAGLAVARGDFVALLDHDDVIERDLLFEYARALNRDRSIDALYCDEDKLTPEGAFAEPFFKPDFEIDLLRSRNYVCHLLCLRRTLLERLATERPGTERSGIKQSETERLTIERSETERLETRDAADSEARGPLDPALDGAQDHDLILRASEITDRIHHVRRILHHWRISAASTAEAAEAKPYVIEAGRRAVENHLTRLGIGADVGVYDFAQAYSVRYTVSEPHPLVSIIIPTKDQTPVLDRCIASIIERSTYDAFEILLVENNSTEPETFEYYRRATERDPRVRVRELTCENGEFNFARIVNAGVREARGDYLLLLNNDIEVIAPDWIERMLGLCERPDVGAVGAKLYFPDDTIQHAGVAMLFWVGPKHFFVDMPRDQGGYCWLNRLPQDLSAVTGACLMTKRSAFDAVGGFDEEYAIDFNDIDFCLRLREAGLLVVYCPDAELYHYESISRGYNDTLDKTARSFRELGRLTRRWSQYFGKGDPAYNLQLENANPYYHLRW